MTARFRNKVAIVTGGANGIGAAIATRLVEEGARVLIADIEANTARGTAEGINARFAGAGGEAHAALLDVRHRSTAEAAVASAVDRWGGLDVLVANAGITDRAPFLEMTDALWSNVIETNLYGVFVCGQCAARQMVAQGHGGRIVNVASNSGYFGGRGRAAYGASKAAIINLTQTMAIELARQQILVNAVAPGPTRTRVTSGEQPPPSASMRMALPRYGEPEEIAEVAAFLASDACSFTTGHVFAADGGFTVTGMMEG